MNNNSFLVMEKNELSSFFCILVMAQRDESACGVVDPGLVPSCVEPKFPRLVLTAYLLDVYCKDQCRVGCFIISPLSFFVTRTH